MSLALQAFSRLRLPLLCCARCKRGVLTRLHILAAERVTRIAEACSLYEIHLNDVAWSKPSQVGGELIAEQERTEQQRQLIDQVSPKLVDAHSCRVFTTRCMVSAKRHDTQPCTSVTVCRASGVPTLRHPKRPAIVRVHLVMTSGYAFLFLPLTERRISVPLTAAELFLFRFARFRRLTTAGVQFVLTERCV